jgi:hypothetical protein
MEQTCSFFIFHWNGGITTAVNDHDSILVCLSTVRHKHFEFGLKDTVLYHNIIQVLPKYTLSVASSDYISQTTIVIT